MLVEIVKTVVRILNAFIVSLNLCTFIRPVCFKLNLFESESEYVE